MHIFITGCTNSGTGFLRFLLSKHPEISTLMEEGQHYSKHLPHDHQFKHVKNRLFSLYPEIYRWFKGEVKKRNGKQIKQDFYKNWDLSKKYLMEKSAHHMIRLEFSNEIFKPCKFIGVVRNGFVVTEGLVRRKGHDIKLCAKHWNRANKIMIEDARKVEGFHLVSYEALVASPQIIINDIFNFIGLDPIEVDTNEKIPRQNIFGRKTHFTLNDSPDFNQLSLDSLTDKQEDMIKKEAGEMLSYFGYM